jgi:hypothetical protein
MTVIRIKQHDFPLPTRYVGGHVCTAAEAAALQQIFAENVRNNVDSWVNKALTNSGRGVLSASDHGTLQERIWEYANEYKFRSIAPKPRTPSPIDVAAEEIAYERAMVECQILNLTPDSATVKELVARYRADPETLEKAREIVSERQEIAAEAIKDLMI